MNNSFLKIEIIDSELVVTFEYKDLEEFKDLMFFIMSQSGLNLIYYHIEKNLVANNKNQELNVINTIIKMLNTEDAETDADSDSLDNDDFTSPYSFS